MIWPLGGRLGNWLNSNLPSKGCAAVTTMPDGERPCSLPEPSSQKPIAPLPGGAARAGDREALEVLCETIRRVYGVACRLTGNDADACDAAQEGVDRYRARLGSLRRSQFSCPLGCTDRRELVDRRDAPARTAAPLPASTPWPSPDGRIEFCRLRIRTRSGRRSPAGCRCRCRPDEASCRLSGRRGAPRHVRMDYQEISEVLGIRPGTVRSRIVEDAAPWPSYSPSRSGL